MGRTVSGTLATNPWLQNLETRLHFSQTPVLLRTLGCELSPLPFNESRSEKASFCLGHGQPLLGMNFFFLSFSTAEPRASVC